MFRRFKSGADEQRWGKSVAMFPTRLESADRGLCFDTRFTYEWKPVDGSGPLLHGDAVAQTLIGSAAAAAARRYEIFSVSAAQAAVNSPLTREISADPRLLVTGEAALSITEETVAAARGRRRAVEQLRAEEAVTTEQLEILRERCSTAGSASHGGSTATPTCSSQRGTPQRRPRQWCPPSRRSPMFCAPIAWTPCPMRSP